MMDRLVNRALGAAARKLGSDWEGLVASSFVGYARTGIAYLDFMPVPMTPCGVRHPRTGAPVYIPRGRAPFDVFGYRGAGLEPATFIAAELKATGEPETSLRIIGEDRHGSGLMAHQLTCLADVGHAGGYSFLLWNNGGQYGVLDRAGIVNAAMIYSTSLASEVAGRGKGTGGSRSIPWEAFRVVHVAPIGGVVCIDWLRFSEPRHE